MKRYASKIEDGTLYVEEETGWLEVGTVEDILELVGGETYSIEYEEAHAQVVEWVETDEDGVYTFDVLDTLEDMTFREEFVGQLAAIDPDRTDEEGYPLRTSFYVDMMTEIWDTKGNLDREESEAD